MYVAPFFIYLFFKGDTPIVLGQDLSFIHLKLKFSRNGNNNMMHMNIICPCMFVSCINDGTTKRKGEYEKSYQWLNCKHIKEDHILSRFNNPFLMKVKYKSQK
jgi:hypothetical protein